MILKSIDSTAVKPTTTVKNVEKLCMEAIKYGFRAVCVQPTMVEIAEKMLPDTVGLVTVVGFPTGAHKTTVKCTEAELAIEKGVNEIDVVWDLGAFKSGEYWQVLRDLVCVVREVEPHTIKVIVEECYLTKEEKKSAWQIVKDSGADFIKTSSGYGKHGATLETVKLWKSLGDDIRIKAAGGIHTLETVKAFLAAGAEIIGTSSGVQIARELNNKEKSSCR